jgi:hypothetical protein
MYTGVRAHVPASLGATVVPVENGGFLGEDVVVFQVSRKRIFTEYTQAEIK